MFYVPNVLIVPLSLSPSCCMLLGVWHSPLVVGMVGLVPRAVKVVWYARCEEPRVGGVTWFLFLKEWLMLWSDFLLLLLLLLLLLCFYLFFFFNILLFIVFPLFLFPLSFGFLPIFQTLTRTLVLISHSWSPSLNFPFLSHPLPIPWTIVLFFYLPILKCSSSSSSSSLILHHTPLPPFVLPEIPWPFLSL